MGEAKIMMLLIFPTPTRDRFRCCGKSSPFVTRVILVLQSAHSFVCSVPRRPDHFLLIPCLRCTCTRQKRFLQPSQQTRESKTCLHFVLLLAMLWWILPSSFH